MTSATAVNAAVRIIGFPSAWSALSTLRSRSITTRDYLKQWSRNLLEARNKFVRQQNIKGFYVQPDKPLQHDRSLQSIDQYNSITLNHHTNAGSRAIRWILYTIGNTHHYERMQHDLSIFSSSNYKPNGIILVTNCFSCTRSFSRVGTLAAVNCNSSPGIKIEESDLCNLRAECDGVD